MKALRSLHRPLVLSAAGVLAALSLAACSTGSTSTDDTEAVSEGEADADAFPVTLQHALGETTIEEEPTEVVAMGYSEADFVLALGVAPIGATNITYGGNENGSTPWQDDAIAAIDGAEQPERLDETDGMPVDDIIALEPDLVTATQSGITEQEYEKITGAGIPVLAYPDAPYLTSWQESLDLIGQALGRSDAAADLAEETDQLVADTAAEFPELEGKTFVWAGPNDADLSSFYAYTPGDNRPRILADLGMENTAFVEEQSEEGQFLFTISSERAAELDADVFVTYAEGEKQIEEFSSNPLLTQIDAIADNRWFASTDPAIDVSMSAPSPLSLPVAMQELVPGIAAAVDGDGSTP